MVDGNSYEVCNSNLEVSGIFIVELVPSTLAIL